MYCYTCAIEVSYRLVMSMMQATASQRDCVVCCVLCLLFVLCVLCVHRINAKDALLQWVKNQTLGYKHVDIKGVCCVVLLVCCVLLCVLCCV